MAFLENDDAGEMSGPAHKGPLSKLSSFNLILQIKRSQQKLSGPAVNW